MTTEYVAVPADWTITQVLHHVRVVERTRETVYPVYVVDLVEHTLIQAVTLRRLISGDPDANVLTAARARRPVTIDPDERREEAIRLISHDDLLAIPLVDARALNEVGLRDWWRVALRKLPTGLTRGAILGTIGIGRIALWQWLGIYDCGAHWPLVAATVGATLIGIVTFGSFVGSMLPFGAQRLGFDVTGVITYFGVAAVILHGTLL